MISIRQAHRDDAAILAMIGVRAWESATAAIGLTDALRENAHLAFGNFVQSAWLSITVAEQDGAIFGWVARENFDDLITDFWIDPPFQRKGIGTALLATVERQITEKGFPAVNLESHAQNELAISFFRKHGYAVSWLSMKYSPKMDRDVQSIGLRKSFAQVDAETYGPIF